MRILIVDDEQFICELLFEFLKSFGEVDTVTDGSQALAKIEAARAEGKPYRLMCLDLNLCGFDGIDILKEVRTQETASKIAEEDKLQVIVITSSYESKYFFEAHDAGCQAYLTKPILRDDLLLKLEDLNLIDPQS